MEILTSNFSPLETSYPTFESSFARLITASDHLHIASGYISTGAILEMKRIIELNRAPKLDLLMGMHYFDGITKSQYDAAIYLNDFLQSHQMGSVSVVQAYKFHGKIYAFSKGSQPIAGIIGSSNLNNILSTHKSYEVDTLFEEEANARSIHDLMLSIMSTLAHPITQWNPKQFARTRQFSEYDGAIKKISKRNYALIRSKATDISFEIPLKASARHSKSNLNVYFGKGRENRHTGFIKPRHWYEVELIVPKEITSHPAYPKAGYPAQESIITVYTDDGWSFECKISGDYSKNFRSNNDLKILGTWIKGRLERCNALKLGMYVTEETLRFYGRSSLTLTATNDPKIWLIDFSQPNSTSL